MLSAAAQAGPLVPELGITREEVDGATSTWMRRSGQPGTGPARRRGQSAGPVQGAKESTSRPSVGRVRPRRYGLGVRITVSSGAKW